MFAWFHFLVCINHFHFFVTLIILKDSSGKETLSTGTKHYIVIEKIFCSYCLQTFNTAQILERHVNDCFEIKGKRIIKSKKRKMKSPFMTYADFESIFVPENNGKQNLIWKLKGKRTSVTESLTKTRTEKLQKAREEHGFRNVWSSDGKILYIDVNDHNRVKVFYD